MTCCVGVLVLHEPNGLRRIETAMSDGRSLPVIDGKTGRPIEIPAQVWARADEHQLVDLGLRLQAGLTQPAMGTLT